MHSKRDPFLFESEGVRPRIRVFSKGGLDHLSINREWHVGGLTKNTPMRKSNAKQQYARRLDTQDKEECVT